MMCGIPYSGTFCPFSFWTSKKKMGTELYPLVLCWRLGSWPVFSRRLMSLWLKGEALLDHLVYGEKDPQVSKNHWHFSIFLFAFCICTGGAP